MKYREWQRKGIEMQEERKREREREIERERERVRVGSRHTCMHCDCLHIALNQNYQALFFRKPLMIFAFYCTAGREI